MKLHEIIAGMDRMISSPAIPTALQALAEIRQWRLGLLELRTELIAKILESELLVSENSELKLAVQQERLAARLANEQVTLRDQSFFAPRDSANVVHGYEKPNDMYDNPY